MCNFLQPAARYILSWSLLFTLGLNFLAHAEELPEASDIREIVTADTPPAGIIFTLREYEDDALEWVLPRVASYLTTIHKKFPDLPVAMLSHGDELMAASTDQIPEFRSMHRLLRQLIDEQGLVFHICESAASMNGLDEADFPDYVSVVPYGPAQVENYLALGYQLVDLELTW